MLMIVMCTGMPEGWTVVLGLKLHCVLQKGVWTSFL